MKQIDALTGLRGLAALMIFAVHAAADDLLPRFIDGGYNKPSILLFFILSGYLITSIYFNKDFNYKNLISFIRARTARIYPLYFIMLVVSLIITKFLYHDFHYDYSNTLKFILAICMVNSPYEPWTIPVEFQLYILFVIVWYLSKRFNKSFLITASIISFITIAATFYLAGQMHKFPRFMPTFAFYFLYGGVISQLVNKEIQSTKNLMYQKIIGKILFLILILFPIIKTNVKVIFLGGWYDPFMVFVIISTFYFISKFPQNYHLLNNKIMLFVGNISFGFYLSHRPIMKFVINHFGTGYLNTFLIFVLSILSGYLTYHLIEMPARRIINRK